MSEPPAKAPSPFQSVAVEALFPTPLWLVDLAPAVAEPLNRRLAAEILRLIEPHPTLPLGANFQTNPVVHRLPEFADLCRLVLQAAKGAQAFLKIGGGTLVITGAWANVNPPGGLNSAHGYLNNFLSAVYNVSIPPGTGAIRFADPRPQAQVLMPPVADARTSTPTTPPSRQSPAASRSSPAGCCTPCRCVRRLQPDVPQLHREDVSPALAGRRAAEAVRAHALKSGCVSFNSIQ